MSTVLSLILKYRNWPICSMLVESRPRACFSFGKHPRGREGGVLPKNLGRGVQLASQNPYPIYEQNLRFSLHVL